MSRLEELLEKLRESHKMPLYTDRLCVEKPTTDEQKEEIAQRVLNAPMPWLMGLGLESAARQYPPGLDDEED